MKKLIITMMFVLFTSSAFAGSCTSMAMKVDKKIEKAQSLRDAGMKAHEAGDHKKSDELFAEAMSIFKN